MSVVADCVLAKSKWPVVPLGGVCRLLNGRAYKKPELLAEGKYRVLRVGNFFTNTNWYHSDLELPPEKYCDDGDLLYAWSASFGPRIWRGEKVIYHYHIWRIDFDPSKVVRDFLYYFFLWDVEKIKAEQGAGTTMIHVTKGAMEQRLLAVPPLPEQERIVAILDEAFEGIATATAHAERNLHNARELFQSVLQSTFEQKGEDWVETTLGEVCENLDSKRVPITKNKRVAGEFPYYGASGVVDHVNDFLFDEDLLLVSEDGANLLARTYPIAFSASGKIWVNNHAHVLRFPNIEAQRFIECFLNSIRLEPYVSGMAQPKLNQKSLNGIPVPAPPLDQQKTIVQELDALSAETRRLESVYQRKLAALAELKQSLLQRAFAGEI